MEKRSDPLIGARAQELLTRAAQLLVDDELNAPLEAGLRALADAAQALLKKKPPKPPGWSQAWSAERKGLPAAEALAALDAMRAGLVAAIEEARGRPVKVDLSACLFTKDPEEQQ